MLNGEELDYLKQRLRKARKESLALPHIFAHTELLLDHIAELQAERDLLDKALDLACISAHKASGSAVRNAWRVELIEEAKKLV